MSLTRPPLSFLAQGSSCLPTDSTTTTFRANTSKMSEHRATAQGHKSRRRRLQPNVLSRQEAHTTAFRGQGQRRQACPADACGRQEGCIPRSVADDLAHEFLDPEHPEEHLEAPTLAERDQLAKRESGVTPTSSMRLRMEAYIKEQQAQIERELEKVEGGKKFKVDTWTRPEGGGGISCVLQDGAVFEKAGVNISVVYGSLPRPAIQRMRANHKALDPDVESLPFFASGISLVLHPVNPNAPTVHLNYRYFETANADGSPNAWWFGGGTDLTPSYLYDEDTIHFHKTIKNACDAHDKTYYTRFKKWCDEYFSVKHRGETRGVGGIFFDDLDEDETKKSQEELFPLLPGLSGQLLAKLSAYYRTEERHAIYGQGEGVAAAATGPICRVQPCARSGYELRIEHARARIESILMSLPLTARWEYMHEAEKNSREARLMEVLRKPIDWI
ncbi:hypothetical protein MRB53_041865 [Persea americana]|nr:hypothetical protein MRB53_041865 [Persea americana]